MLIPISSTFRLIAGLLSVVGLVMPAMAQKVDGPKVAWNFNMFGNKRAVTWGQEELARQLSEATGGNFTMTIHYGDALGPARESIDALSIGAYDMSVIVPGYTPGKLPVLEATGLPFLPIPTIYHATASREALLAHPASRADVARWCAVITMQVPIGINEFIGKGTPPLTLAAWKGKRVRAVGGDARAMQILGAVASSMPQSEVYGGVERGMLDAISSLPYAHVAFKLHEITNWYTTNMGISSPASFVMASNKSYDALAPQYKKLIADLSPSIMRRWIDVFKRDDDSAINAYKARGMTPITYPNAELDKLRIAAKPIWDEWIALVAKQGHNGQEILDKMIQAANATKVSG
jgi:TRAP-type C4-dicarboxylate transport system substrate-binding protein